MKKLIAFVVLASTLNLAWAEDKTPYDEAANAKEQIQAALKSAKAQNKSA